MRTLATIWLAAVVIALTFAVWNGHLAQTPPRAAAVTCEDTEDITQCFDKNICPTIARCTACCKRNGGGSTCKAQCEYEIGPVGGMAEYPDVARAPAGHQSASSGSSDPPYAALAGGLAAAVLALSAGAVYARRHWLT